MFAFYRSNPAVYSSFAELQAESGSQMISFFSTEPFRSCKWDQTGRIWTQGFANWYDQKSVDGQTGFGSTSRGLCLGLEGELVEDWRMGIGAVWQYGSLSWHQQAGHGDVHGYYGAFYTDYQTENFWIGSSFLAGKDFRFGSRHIRPGFLNVHAQAKSEALDLIAQVRGAYFFGIPTFLVYPFVDVDFFYLQNSPFQEQDAGILNLYVHSWTDMTLRTEACLALQLLEMNRDESLCFSTLLTFGWVMQNPISRQLLSYQFVGSDIETTIEGWDKTWQLWAARLGFRFNIYSFAISANYRAEVTVDSNDYFAQKGDVQIDWSW